MIITKTPYRISFFGGGTDLKIWYEENEGFILSTSINKYCTLVVRELEPSIPYNFRVVWRELEEENNINKIKHPIIREAIKQFPKTNKLSVYHEGDLSSNSGIASSSAFTCGILKALNELNQVEITKRELVKQAIFLEREILNEAGGIQDQIATGFGGFNYIKIGKNGDFCLNPVQISNENLQNLQNHLMLFFTGIKRNASTISAEQINNTKIRQQDLTEIAKMPLLGLKMIESTNPDFEGFGKLLHEGWLLKKNLSSKISNNIIDNIYDLAIRNGALGGKLLGAGGGGFIIIFAKPEHQKQIANALTEYDHIPFAFEEKGCHLFKI